MIDGKRLFDLGVCVVVAPIALPLGGVIALAVRLLSGPPVLFRGRRAGRGGGAFTILKFRTMDVGVPGSRLTAAHDPRVTRIGHWLRRTKLDELPQLLNVVRGDMAIVGPRPEDPRYTQLHPDEYAVILTVRPGVTGPAALEYRDEEAVLQHAVRHSGDDLETVYARDVLPAKIALDLEYVRSNRLRTDLVIVFSTVAVLLGRKRAAQTAAEAADGTR